jgi:hypothetical protein
MNSTFKLLGLGASITVGALLVGCGTGDDNGDSTGGTSSTGGSSSTSGGSTSTGGTGGASGSGVTKLFMFNTDHEGFSINASKSDNVQYVNLANPATTPPPSLGFAATKDYGNDPNSGSIKIDAPFSFWNQSVTAEVAAPQDKSGAPIDFSHKIVKAEIFVEKGLSPFTMDSTSAAPGGVVFFMKSGTTFAWGQAAWKNVESYGSWIQIKFNTDSLDAGSKPDFDPSNVSVIGFQFSSGGGGTHCPDSNANDPNSAAFMGAPTATCPAWPATLDTVIYVDSITVESNL